MTVETWLWITDSETYKYEVYPIGTELTAVPGNYIFAKQIDIGWEPLYVGETGDLYNRLPNHEKLPCVNANGGTHVHVRFNSNEQSRRDEESDLIALYNPTCNG